MSIGVSELSAADVAAVVGNNGGRNNNDGMFGNDWAWIIILLLFGYGGRGFGGLSGGYGAGAGYGAPCATQADVRAAVDQQTLISKIDQQTYGLADATYSLNNTINANFDIESYWSISANLVSSESVPGSRSSISSKSRILSVRFIFYCAFFSFVIKSHIACAELKFSIISILAPLAVFISQLSKPTLSIKGFTAFSAKDSMLPGIIDAP